MPYIVKERREALNTSAPQNAGELNYLFTFFSLLYLAEKGEKYQTYNDIIGALEGCKQELYRRKVALYEDKKILSNGDVF